MPDKQILITGSSAGIGKAAAMQLTRQGAHVTIHGRDSARCEAVAAEIRIATSNPFVDSLAFDLSSLAAVREGAARYTEKHASLDVLILNAGAFFAKRQLSADGFERTLALGFLGQFLLTELLLPCLHKAEEGRVILVAAPLDGARVDFDDLQLEKSYSFMKAVPQAKALSAMALLDLPLRPEGRGLSCNYLHPGIIKTDLLRETPWILRSLASLFGASPEKGADTVVWLATDPGLKGISGKFFIKRKEAPIKGLVAVPANWKRATALAQTLCGL